MPERDPEAEVRACYATWSERYHSEYYGPDAAYPPIHRDLVVDLLRASGATTVLDAGCGPASFLREIRAEPVELYGFDLTPEMVAEARRVLETDRRIWQGSVLDPSAFRCPDEPDLRFDAALSIGVLPHVPQGADARVFIHLRDAVRPGGLVIASARNQLFGLFTLNRYSHDLFRDELIRADDLAAQADDEERAGLKRALASLEERFRMDLPPRRAGYEKEPGYDEVLSRTHNPFVLRRHAEDAGLTDVRVLFYHYHALPPMLEAEAPGLFRRASLAMEDPDDWRGYVMASAFLVAGRRP